MKEEEKVFKNILKLLKQVCFDGQLHYSIWRNLNTALVEDPNIYFSIEIFLGTTLNAHFEASVSRLFRLLDNHQDSINITYLLNFIESNPCILEYINKDKLKIELDNDRNLLTSKEEIIKNLKTLRDKYYVHLDKKYKVSHDKLFKENKITYSEIDELFNQLDKTLIKYENYFYNYPEYIGGYYGRDDVKLVMQILKEYMINKK